ncbi:monofunctional biosynthetic peptidoglycan transglycosylase [Hoylesella nanceiensis]|jgi:monofunctional biosynthetic peptidoglycan transglycosylase|uniref:Biosynthetic peptidoglycan transglycosylase n=1 Tax=Hoylesella nanceiensis TaxID=425941 RepID=A0ABS6YA24_9BACT|nr:monofunctional biosynthetic peptidoglycan transglycosylase [Hoylesella nanceiensis]MBF1440362.1 monofunctional biosynthetic peptidoglycan transglycosylase [Hoylesella nanceiensis]MBW4768425.1 monofunctional biosynthetic peptidoglycan transglycosylase [Hoylesella nanceiensis]
MRLLRKIIRWTLALFFGSSILAVVLYRFMPVYITPLMIIRYIQHSGDDEGAGIHHSWVPLSEMSKYMPVAVIASEDQRFMTHHGFDYDAIEKAAIHNMKKNGKKLGASTISQQTAKNVFLWPGRSWIRKGFEVYFTALIELMWSKQRIMEVYLNSIEMGKGIYGVSAVAKYHFEANANELTRSDCALIAATLPNPIKFNSAHPSAYIRKRQRQILVQMRHVPLMPKEGEDPKEK